MTKQCKYQDIRCYRSSCDIFNPVSGNVEVCGLYRGGDMFARRRVGGSAVSIFNLLDGRVERRRRGF